MIDTVEDRWRALLARGEPELREVDAESPLRMLIGVSPVGRPYFAVIVAQKPGLPISPAPSRSHDGSVQRGWTLDTHTRAASTALTDAFISLVSDWRQERARASEQEALNIFLETLAEWQELLTARADRLSESALRGLIAELWFGFESEAQGILRPKPPERGLAHWAAPKTSSSPLPAITSRSSHCGRVIRSWRLALRNNSMAMTSS